MRAARLWLGLSALLAPIADAQERPISWSAPATTLRVAAGRTVRIPVRARIDTGWKLYSLTQMAGGPIATRISLRDTTSFSLGTVDAPEPTRYPDRNFNIFTEIYTDTARFSVPVRAKRTAKPERHDLALLVRFQTCTDRYCLPPRTDTLVVRLQVEPAAIATATEDEAPPPPPGAQPGAPAVSPVRADIVAPTDLASVARFAWLALTMGLLSLLTPCILPMIPITVGYFSGNDETRRRTRTVSALAHALGIVGAFTLLGFLVSAFFGAGAIVRLAASPWLNVVIAALFIAFALNLLGVFEITLPQRLLTSVTRAEGRGSAAGALLMGGAFAVTSFTCTVPFVGTLLVLATQGSWRWPLFGLALYGAAFALPFFILALAPGALQRLPRSGPWLTVLKTSFAIVEIALAIKFLSNVDLVLGVGLLTRENVLWLWIVAAVAVAFVVLFFARSGRPTIWRVGFATLALWSALWLGRGVRGSRLGELEAYLPPSTHDAALPWIRNDYAGALTLAAAEQKPVILDFTGYTCTNCRWMEANMFPRDDVRDLLSRYVRVRLFTDGIGEPYESQQRFQLERFGSVALPYYAVLSPDGRPVATFLGMTRDTREFSAFLEKALQP